MAKTKSKQLANILTFTTASIDVVSGCHQSRRLLHEQLLLGAVLALGLPIINALTTDGHLIASLGRGDWALASVDLFMIVAGLVCAACAWRLNATPAAAAVRGRSTRVQEA